MNIRLLAAAILPIAFALPSARAQTNGYLDWVQCLAQAGASNPDLVSARSAVRELEYGVASASSGFLPQLDASAGATKSGSENDGNWTENDRTSADLSLSQDLFTGGGNLARRRRAQAQLAIGNEQYRQTLSDVELRVRLAYVDLLYAQDLVDLTRKIATRRADNVRLIQLRFDGGRENAGSLARSKAQYSEAQYEVREAERGLVYARRNLAAAMGLMEPPAGAQGDLRAAEPEPVDALRKLMQQTPDYTIALTQIEAAKQGMLVTRSARFPSLRFSASAGLGNSDHGPYDGNWSMGLRASMPLFTGNQLKNDVAAAKERIVQTEMDLVDTGNTLMATLQQRWNTYADAVENERVQKELLDAELLRADISGAKYKQGLLTYEDWDIIESNLINLGKTYLQRRRLSEQEQARWRNALGRSEWYATGRGE